MQKNSPAWTSRLLLALVLAAVCIGLDQYTKKLAVEHLQNEPTKSYLGDTLRIQFALNPGAFLGFGNRLSEDARFWLLTVATGVFLTAIAVYLVLHWRMVRIRFVSLVLIVSGGIGNLIDRAFDDGVVVDFLNVGIGWLRTGIFNVADMAITGGVIVLFLESFRKPEAEAQEDPAASSA